MTENKTITTKNIIAVLKKHGYKVKYTSYHTKKHIASFKDKKEVYANDLFFTVCDAENRVIGRCHAILKEDTVAEISSVEKIKSYFEMYNIKNHENVVEDLDQLIFSIV